MIYILSFIELEIEKKQVVKKVENIINSNEQSFELSTLDMICLLIYLGEKNKEYMPKKLEDSLLASIIKSENKLFSKAQISVIYKVSCSFKMNDDYNAILLTLLQTSATIKNNITKAKDNSVDIKVRSDLVAETESLLKLNYSQLIEISKSLKERGPSK